MLRFYVKETMHKYRIKHKPPTSQKKKKIVEMCTSFILKGEMAPVVVLQAAIIQRDG